MEKLQWYATVDNGKLQIPQREEFAVAVAQFSGPVVITIDRPRSKRSSAQNRYLFGVIYKHLSEFTGHTAEELHEICKVKFNLKKYDLPNEEHVEAGGTTTKLSTKEFEEYCENIRRWAADSLGVVIPEPGQSGWLD